MSSMTKNQPADEAALVEPARRVDAYLRAFLKRRPLPDSLAEAVEYALLGPGKRMRPILVMRSCEAVGGTMDDALAPAGAIEMIHAFSLVHDDLPAMDDDDLRRGRPTLHKHTSDAMAILAGDALMSLAFELIGGAGGGVDGSGDGGPEAGLSRRLSAELSQATTDMIAGQVYDTMPEQAFPASVAPLDRLRTIHHHKTGALLRAACRMGGLCGGADEAGLEALTRYARAIGLMFQVVDDLLDVTQSADAMGKATGKDAPSGKLTYPGLMGVEQSKAEVDRLHAQAHAALEGLPRSAQPLHELCDYLAVRRK